jgi:TRAP-type C4-dicarboxylate transport system permease small subunit
MFFVGNALAIAGAFIVVLLAFPIAFDAIARKAGHPTTWAFDLSLYLMVALVYLSVAGGIHSGHHFRVGLLTDRVPVLARASRYVDGISVLLFGLALTIAGANLVATSYATDIRSTTLLAVPLYIPQILLPIAGIVLCLQAIGLVLTPETEPHAHT